MSAIPAVTGAIFTTLSQGLTGPKVVFGYDTAPEMVAIWETEFTREYRLLGPDPTPQDERFKVGLIVEVLRPSGRDMKTVTGRAWEIFDAADGLLRGDHTIGGLSWNALIEQGKQEFFQTAEQQGCRIRAVLAGTARI